MSTPTTTNPRARTAQAANNPSTPSASGGAAGATPRSNATPSNSQQQHSQLGGPGFLSPAASRSVPAGGVGKSPNPASGTPSKPGASFSGTPQSSAAGKTLPGGLTGGSHGSPGATGTTPVLTGALGYHSPAALEALGMGASISNMGLSSSQMGLTASALGMGSTGGLSMSGKLDDETRRRRLEEVLALLGRRTGRVGQEGLERLAKRLGLDPAWEAGVKLGDGRLLSFAGTTIVVDVEFLLRQPDLPCRVALQYHGLSRSVNEFAEAAAGILHQDLLPPPGTAQINASLNAFATNLERLSRLDKLSVPGLSCFEAIDGVYRSLQRIYEHERRAARALLGDDASDERVEADVLCKRSGAPKMHARRKVGLQIDYWRRRRLVPGPKASKTVSFGDDVDVMDLDHPGDSATPLKAPAEADPDVYSLVIEAEHALPALYPPIRNSPNWVAERVERPPDDTDLSLDTLLADRIDWQDPPPTDTAAAQPQARFVARLDPPVPVLVPLARPLYASVGVDISSHFLPWWHKMVLNRAEVAAPIAGAGDGASDEYRFHVARDVPDRAGALRAFQVDLTLPPHGVPETIAVCNVEVVPFSHPKQIVALLPTLRQHALLASLVSSSLGVYEQGTRVLRETKAAEPLFAAGAAGAGAGAGEGVSDGFDVDAWLGGVGGDGDVEAGDKVDGRKDAEGDEEIGGNEQVDGKDGVEANDNDKKTPKIDMEVRLDGPAPRITLVVPTRRGDMGLTFEIVTGGELVYTSCAAGERIGRAWLAGLAVAEDACTWAQWAAGLLDA